MKQPKQRMSRVATPTLRDHKGRWVRLLSDLDDKTANAAVEDSSSLEDARGRFIACVTDVRNSCRARSHIQTSLALDAQRQHRTWFWKELATLGVGSLAVVAFHYADQATIFVGVATLLAFLHARSVKRTFHKMSGVGTEAAAAYANLADDARMLQTHENAAYRTSAQFDTARRSLLKRLRERIKRVEEIPVSCEQLEQAELEVEALNEVGDVSQLDPEWKRRFAEVSHDASRDQSLEEEIEPVEVSQEKKEIMRNPSKSTAPCPS